MADRSGIEWTGATWNPVTGCDRVSPGCDNCYAMTLAARLKAMGQPKYQRDGDPRTSGPGFGVSVHPEVLNLPMRWRRPRLVFVNSMSDLFHRGVPDEFIACVFAVMAATGRHTYQVLTKRHARMRALLTSPGFEPEVRSFIEAWADEEDSRFWEVLDDWHWPARNVWLGVSVEDQKRAELRLPALRETPAAVRFVSAEPLLGPLEPLDLSGIGWVVAGGESGPAARLVRPEWVRLVRDACTAAGVPFFFKQWGGRTPKALGRLLDGRTWDEMPGGGGGG